MKDKIEWAMGVFEGEGNIYRNDKRRHFIMSVQMKDEDIIKRFQNCVGCGNVIKRKPYLDYAPMWEWRLSNTNDILKLTTIFLPVMGVRRKKQILKAINGKVFVKGKRILKKVSECGTMGMEEVSCRGAKRHVARGEKPCPTCAERQRIYLRLWRKKAFFEANQQHGRS